MNEEREMNIHHYNTINNILNKDINESRTNNYADNNLSYYQEVIEILQKEK